MRSFLSLFLKYKKLSFPFAQRLLCVTRLPVGAVSFSQPSGKKFIWGSLARPFVASFLQDRVRFFERRKSAMSLAVRLKTLRGFGHLFKLPVNGQRTKTNAMTRKRGVAFSLHTVSGQEIKSKRAKKLHEKKLKKKAKSKQKNRR